MRLVLPLPRAPQTSMVAWSVAMVVTLHHLPPDCRKTLHGKKDYLKSVREMKPLTQQLIS